MLGDANRGFFHAVTQGRRAKNRLAVIEDDEGIPWFEEDHISKVLCCFYEKLFSSSPHEGSDIVTKALKPCITA